MQTANLEIGVPDFNPRFPNQLRNSGLGHHHSSFSTPLTQFSSVGEMSGKNFNEDNSIQTSITGFINLAHSTRTDN